MEEGWQEYLKSMEKRTNERLDRLERNTEKLLEFHWKVIGGAVATSFLVTVLVQAAISFLEKFGNH